MHFTDLHALDGTEGTVQLRQNLAALSTSPGSDLILHPRPNAHDANDPLRWSAWRKHTAFAAICLFTFLTIFGITGMAPAFPVVAPELGVAQGDVTNLIIWPLFLFGAGNFFWVPLANTIGKRPVFVFATAVNAAAQAWAAAAGSFESLFAATMLATAMGSTTEALGASMVNDVYFLHERSGKMGIYIAAISLGNGVGPLVCGYMAQTVGWRWFKGLTAILVGVNFLLVLFFVPETRYLARDLSHEGDYLSPPSSLEQEALKPKGAETPSSMHTPPDFTFGGDVPKKVTLQQLSLLPTLPPHTTFNSILVTFLRPLPLVVFPSVIYAILAYGISLAWVISISTLLPFVLASPLYNFSPGATGLMNIPSIIGAIVGAALGGVCVDKYSDYRARRNGGVFKPEFRLPLLLIPILLVPSGLLIVGYGIGNNYHWVSIAFGFGLASLALTAVPASAMTYVSDILLPVQTDALLVVNGVKNIIAFAFTYAVVPWSQNQGFIDLCGTQAGLYVAIVGGGALVLVLFGEKWRLQMARWKVVLQA